MASVYECLMGTGVHVKAVFKQTPTDTGPFTVVFKDQSGRILKTESVKRKLFAYVTQGNLLLSGTIRESIGFVKSDATDEEIMAAAQVSCAAEFISVLPYGLNTVIGEKGQGLSEGQVQRLAIARAVLSGAPILLLDEATSALDEATEGRLLNNIKEMTDKTCIIISHKKEALSVCNKEIRIGNTIVVTTLESRARSQESASKPIVTMERSEIPEYHSA